MNSNLKMMLESVILDSVNSIIDEFWLEKEGKWSVYSLHKGVGEGGDISGITPPYTCTPTNTLTGVEDIFDC